MEDVFGDGPGDAAGAVGDACDEDGVDAVELDDGAGDAAEEEGGDEECGDGDFPAWDVVAA